jgi:hypothetical protein
LIPKPKHAKAARSQKRISSTISLRPFLMLPAVDFDDQAAFHANEVDDKGPQWMLAPELQRAHATRPEQVPQPPFRVG